MFTSRVSKITIVMGTALAAAALLPAGAASAGDKYRCPSGSFCAWEDDDFNGNYFPWEGNDSNWGTGSSYWINNDAESVYNRGVQVSSNLEQVWLYNGAGYTDVDVCIERGEWYDQDFGSAFDDNVYSSHSWHTSCSNLP